MKLLRFIFCMMLACSTNVVSAEETGGLWGWISGVTSSAWEGTKNTFNSIFGIKSDEQRKESYKKEERVEKPTETEYKKEEVVTKEK